MLIVSFRHVPPLLAAALGLNLHRVAPAMSSLQSPAMTVIFPAGSTKDVYAIESDEVKKGSEVEMFFAPGDAAVTESDRSITDNCADNVESDPGWMM